MKEAPPPPDFRVPPPLQLPLSPTWVHDTHAPPDNWEEEAYSSLLLLLLPPTTDRDENARGKELVSKNIEGPHIYFDKKNWSAVRSTHTPEFVGKPLR